MSAAAFPSTMSATFRRIILARPAGTTLTVDTIRDELNAAQIPPRSLGPLFKAACHAGLLDTGGWTVPSRDPIARGRRILVYRVLAQDDPWAEDVA